ncbi:MAG: hypothetical protein HY528_03670 [Chloroflexi bacterium]|nr:hypothetical protein [Chloroflexota bacterium]
MERETSSYRFILGIEEAEEMLTPEQAKTAKEGEVMMGTSPVSMQEGPMPNHHLEVQIHNKKNGDLIKEPMPKITVGDKELMIMAMYGLKSGESDMHFGNNLYLADGNYTVKVSIGGETAVFDNVVVGR